MKRVAQELGGKSANIVLVDADFDEVITRDVMGVVVNAGQSCNAGSRILVPSDRMDEACAIAKAAARRSSSGLPTPTGPPWVPLCHKHNSTRSSV